MNQNNHFLARSVLIFTVGFLYTAFWYSFGMWLESYQPTNVAFWFAGVLWGVFLNWTERTALAVVDKFINWWFE